MSIFSEVQNDTFQIEDLDQLTTDVTAIVAKLFYDFSLRRRDFIKTSLKPEYRSLCSATNDPTRLLFADDLSKHVKDLTIINRLKRYEAPSQANKVVVILVLVVKSITEITKMPFLGRGRELVK